MSDLTLLAASSAVLWLFVVFHSAILVELLRRGVGVGWGPSPTPSAGADSKTLRLGTPAPEFIASELFTGERIASATWRGARSVLVFVSPACSVCEDAAAEMRAFTTKSDMRLVGICRGGPQGCAQFAHANLPNVPVLLDNDGAIAQAFRIEQTPTAVEIDEEGRVYRYGYPRTTARIGLEEWSGPPDAQPR